MKESFSKNRQRFNEALDQAEASLREARGLLDDLPSVVRGETQSRQLFDAHQTMRDALRTRLRFLEKL